MRVRQYVALALMSESASVDEMISVLGTQPDRSSERGSRQASPPIPRFNIWELQTNDSGLTVDAQLQLLMDRAVPLVSAIRTLIERWNCGAELQVVRYFDEGEEEAAAELHIDGRTLQKLPGQHHLLGWHLDPNVLQFMVDTGCELDIDEYG